MRNVRVTKLAIGLVGLGLLAGSSFWVMGPLPVAATSPCDSITEDDDPPVGQPELLGGTVRDASTNGGVSGATLTLYRCADGSGAYVTSTTTNSSGYYEFDELLPRRWYYIEAVMTGPLAGMTPAPGTSNPTDPLGETSTTVDLTFE